MQITETLDNADLKKWRAWLKKYHKTKKEIWLVYYRKSSGKPRISYNDSVEEALCWGWIDSTYKKIDDQKFCQRFSPRRPTSKVSEMNKERMRRLIREKRMTPAGLDAVKKVFDHKKDVFEMPKDILKKLKKDTEVWKNFQKFPKSYQTIRVGWIAMTKRPDEYKKRLKYFLKMTKQNKRYGMVQ